MFKIVVMAKCLSQKCEFLTHKNGYCCNACKNNGTKHGDGCGRIGFKGGVEERSASSEQMSLNMSPLFDLSNCNVVFNHTVGSVQKNYKITLAWSPVVGATSYKVVYTYYCGTPNYANSIINNNTLAIPYFFANFGSNSRVPEFLEISSSNTTADIIVNPTNYNDTTRYADFNGKMRMIFYVYAYKGTIRGPAPTTVLLFNFFSYGQINETTTSHSDILGLLKHNISANMQLSPLNNKAYTLNNHYTNTYIQKDLSNEMDINDPYFSSFWETKKNDGSFTTYADISNEFTDLHAIKCKRFVTSGTDNGRLITTPILN